MYAINGKWLLSFCFWTWNRAAYRHLVSDVVLFTCPQFQHISRATASCHLYGHHHSVRLDMQARIQEYYLLTSVQSWKQQQFRERLQLLWICSGLIYLILLQPDQVNSHLHSHPSSACGCASKLLPDGVCFLRVTASLIDLASSVSWADLHLGQSNLNSS